VITSLPLSLPLPTHSLGRGRSLSLCGVHHHPGGASSSTRLYRPKIAATLIGSALLMSVGTYLGTCHISVSVYHISVSVSVPVSVAMSAGACAGTCVCARSSGMRQIYNIALLTASCHAHVFDDIHGTCH